MKERLIWFRSKSLFFIGLIVAVPLVLTYLAWHVTSDNVRITQRTKFETLAQESEKALQFRMKSYYQALLGGKGFYEGSSVVDHNEWKAYVAAVDILKNFPGINGIGTIYDLKGEDIPAYIEKMRANSYSHFSIHPQGEYAETFVITYIEPVDINAEAVGLNIAFESNRREAAIKSRDSGRAAITKRILLVQDAEKTPGFLLLLPTYDKSKAITTVEHRRQAFKRWLYAPFIGKNFMRQLTDRQGKAFHLQVYDGGLVSEDALIYDSNSNKQDASQAKFLIKKKIQIMQQDWLMVWSSTESFERIENSQEPFLILVLGMLFTGMFTVFVIALNIQTGSVKNIMLESYIIPVLAFLVTVIAALYLQKEITSKEERFIGNANMDAAHSIADAIMKNVDSRILGLGRMAQRWNIRPGMPYQEWEKDAESFLKDQPGLKAIEWVDNAYHVRWAVPVQENKNIIGLDVRFNKEREDVLKVAAGKNTTTVTPPLNLVQGYKAFISYSPVHVKNRFDGFIVGVFGIDELIDASLLGIKKTDFNIYLKYDNQIFFSSTEESIAINKNRIVTKSINFNNEKWMLHVSPTREFIRENTSYLPELILSIGLILAIMIALIINFAQRSKMQTAMVEEKENLLSTFVKHTPAAVAMFDSDIRYIAASDRWYKDYGLIEKNIIGQYHYDIFPEIIENHPEWLKLYMRAVNGEIIKSEEEMFIRKNGDKEWLRYELRPWKGNQNDSGGMIMFTENISERKRMDVMKDEFISTVNHELRTPLTSIQASLGLLKASIFESLDNKGKRLLELSYNNCQRLAQLVNDILDMEKIAAGKMEYNLKPTEMHSLVQDVAEQNKSYAEKYNVTIKVESEISQVYCLVDPNRITQAMVNLISNAAKFSPNGGTVKISLALINENQLRISIVDRGPGIPKDFHEKIFDKFVQVDSSSTRNKNGTGLGLNITKSIIEAFNGSIAFDTQVGQGTTFYFILKTCHHNVES